MLVKLDFQQVTVDSHILNFVTQTHNLHVILNKYNLNFSWLFMLLFQGNMTSRCSVSASCVQGERKVTPQDKQVCCFECEKCPNNTFSNVTGKLCNNKHRHWPYLSMLAVNQWLYVSLQSLFKLFEQMQRVVRNAMMISGLKRAAPDAWPKK